VPTNPFSATSLWRLSMRWSAAGHPRPAKVVKAVNFYLHRTLLATECEVGARVRLEHHGFGIVIHPNVTIGDDVVLWHNVTIAADTLSFTPHKVRVGDGVMLGTGATVVARPDRDLVIGAGARIGAGAVVTGDVEPGATYVGVPARRVQRRPDR